MTFVQQTLQVITIVMTVAAAAHAICGPLSMTVTVETTIRNGFPEARLTHFRDFEEHSHQLHHQRTARPVTQANTSIPALHRRYAQDRQSATIVIHRDHVLLVGIMNLQVHHQQAEHINIIAAIDLHRAIGVRVQSILLPACLKVDRDRDRRLVRRVI